MPASPASDDQAPADLPDLLRPVDEVAPELLGCRVRHGDVVVRLTEVEAYAGPDDAASHAWRGPTPRTEVMFGPAGRLYVYLSYGMHHCANLVVGPDGTASAVLLRAGEVVEGLDVARARRPGVRDVDLARGPGRLCKALGVELAHGGRDLVDGGGADVLRLEPRRDPAPVVVAGPRVGVSRAADVPWRFRVEGDPTVSTYRAAAPRRRS